MEHVTATRYNKGALKHAMMAYREKWGTAPVILNHGTDGGRFLSMPQPPDYIVSHPRRQDSSFVTLRMLNLRIHSTNQQPVPKTHQSC